MSTYHMRCATIHVSQKYLEHCAIKAKFAHEMLIEELEILLDWVNTQFVEQYNELTLQEILNVYRVSAKWETWEAWYENDPLAAVEGWNRAVCPADMA